MLCRHLELSVSSLNLSSSLCIKILKLWLFLPIHPAKINFLALLLLHFDYCSIFFFAFDTVLLNYIHNMLAKIALLINSITPLSRNNILSRLAEPGWSFSGTPRRDVGWDGTIPEVTFQSPEIQIILLSLEIIAQRAEA